MNRRLLWTLCLLVLVGCFRKPPVTVNIYNTTSPTLSPSYNGDRMVATMDGSPDELDNSVVEPTLFEQPAPSVPAVDSCVVILSVCSHGKAMIHNTQLELPENNELDLARVLNPHGEVILTFSCGSVSMPQICSLDLLVVQQTESGTWMKFRQSARELM